MALSIMPQRLEQNVITGEKACPFPFPKEIVGHIFTWLTTVKDYRSLAGTCKVLFFISISLPTDTLTSYPVYRSLLVRNIFICDEKCRESAEKLILAVARRSPTIAEIAENDLFIACKRSREEQIRHIADCKHAVTTGKEFYRVFKMHCFQRKIDVTSHDFLLYKDSMIQGLRNYAEVQEVKSPHPNFILVKLNTTIEELYREFAGQVSVLRY